MKILLLTLVVFTGCHANLLQADNPKPQLEVLTDAIFDSMRIVFKTVDDAGEKFKRTTFGHIVIQYLHDGLNGAIIFVIGHDTRPPREVTDTMATAVNVMSEISGFVHQQVETLRDKLQPVAERAAPVMEIVAGELTQRTQQLRDMAIPQIDKLIDKVDPLAKEVQAHLLYVMRH